MVCILLILKNAVKTRQKHGKKIHSFQANFDNTLIKRASNIRIPTQWFDRFENNESNNITALDLPQSQGS